MSRLSLPHWLPLLALLLTTPVQADFPFNDNGDGTVTDAVTGLMWDKCAWGLSGNTCATGSPGDYTWPQALSLAVVANAMNGGAGYKNHRDWRLPNVKELESLVKITAASPAIDGTAFPNTPSGYRFLTSSVFPPVPAWPWWVDFSVGKIDATVGTFAVRLVRSGQSFAAFDFLLPCGTGLGLTTGATALWHQLALPCVPATTTVGTTLGANTTGQLNAAIYNNAASNGWLMFGNDLPNNQNLRLGVNDTLTNGVGYWLKSFAAPSGGGNLEVTGTATPAPVTTGDGCASANGCKAIAVTTVAGADRYNLVGNPFPYNVDWAQVRVRVKTSGGSLVGTYTPSQAAGIGDGAASPAVMSNQIWIYNGNAYDTWTDVSVPNPGNLKYFQSFWVKVLAAANPANYTVELLIPAEQSTHSQRAPATDTRLAAAAPPWYRAWLDWLIAPAAAADTASDFGLAQHPGTHPAEHPAWALPQSAPPPSVATATVRAKTVTRATAQGLVAGREWYVRLLVDEPATGYKDHNSVLGQLLSAQDGYDPRDLAELPPFGKPYLTLVFPHPEWVTQAGDYASDFRSAQKLNPKGRPVPGLPAADWTFTIRADRPDTPVILRWEGDPAVLRNSQLIDPTVRKPIKLKDYPDGYPVTLTGGSRTLTWRYLGQTGLLR